MNLRNQSGLYLSISVNLWLNFNGYAVHPRSVQILGVATLNRDPNALTALTAIRSINPRFEKIDNYNKPLFKILLILKSFLDQVFLAD